MTLDDLPEILGSLEKGDLAKDFKASIDRVLAAMASKDTAKGSVTLKLNFESEGHLVTVRSDITEKLPKEPRRTSGFFLTNDGRLSTQSPNQIDMFASRRGAAVDV